MALIVGDVPGPDRRASLREFSPVGVSSTAPTLELHSGDPRFPQTVGMSVENQPQRENERAASE